MVRRQDRQPDFLFFRVFFSRRVLISCGDDGDRTRDLVVANHALSQLSYTPRAMTKFKIPMTRSKIHVGIWSLVIRHWSFPQWVYLGSNQGPQPYQGCALAN
jgi:hypothetical protein